MKINYKITTIVLAIILILSFVWQSGNFSNKSYSEKKMSAMRGGHMMADGSMMMDMVANMKGKSGKDLEKAFITDMIPHHQGAVDMAKILLQDKTIRPELVKFANDIIAAQEAEIRQMQEWLKGY